MIEQVYNNSRILTAAIYYVITQSIVFESITQLMLVNDESTGESSSICLEYQAQYPNNVLSIKQENAGASATCNAGLYYCDIKYIIFLNAELF